MASTSPTQRTLTECKKRGWPAYVCEKWIPRANIRKDAFGFGDVLAIDGEPGSILIQATTTPNAPRRVAKILDECTEDATAWLQAGNRIAVWGWAKRGAAGKRKLWTLKVYQVKVDDDGQLYSLALVGLLLRERKGEASGNTNLYNGTR